MKISAVVVILLAGFFSLSAQTKSDVFNTNEIVWYGLDFSNVKLIGSEGFTDPSAIKNRFFNSWNQLIISEPEKYDLAKTFSKEKVENDLSVVTERNDIPKVEELVINEPYVLNEDRIPEILKQYNYKQTSGIGLVFIMESFNKPAEQGTMYVTFFDIATKKPLLVKKMSGKPGGFGIRNYWAASYYNVLKDSKKEYKKWMKG